MRYILMTESVFVDHIQIGGTAPWILISGPCVIETEQAAFETALFLKKITEQLNIPFIFKASYDKANRSSVVSYRGPGFKRGLEILGKIKKELNIHILSDVHSVNEISAAAEVLDVIQIPAFLCRQTDLVIEIAKTNKAVNIKKGQFLSPWDMNNIVEKITSVGNRRILLTERGSTFGYNNLVVDFRSIPILQQTGFPVIFDATHSVQLPGGQGTSSGGQREFAPLLAKAAMACGANGIFLEVHKDPDKALCDGPNSLYLDQLETLLKTLTAIRKAVNSE